MISFIQQSNADASVMKDLKLKSLKFNAKHMLSREQMKGIKGGTGITILCECNGVPAGYCIAKPIRNVSNAVKLLAADSRTWHIKIDPIRQGAYYLPALFHRN